MKRPKRAKGAGNAFERRFVALPFWMLSTDAYRSLRPVSRALLVELHALFNGSNNGKLFLSVREAAKRLGVGKSTASAALAELTDRGFVRPLVAGTFHRKTRHATTWVLTLHSLGDALPTKDFARWRPPAEPPGNQNAVPVAGQSVPRGGQIAARMRATRPVCPSGGTVELTQAAASVPDPGHR
jgi:DNA-binding MarR family transcriptional regulator